jgi:hypothetical protein
MPFALTISSWFDLLNNIWGWVQIMKFLIVQLHPFSCYFIPLWSKYSPQNPFLKDPQCMLLPECERQSFTPIQNKWQIYGFVWFNVYIPFGDSRWEDKRCRILLLLQILSLIIVLLR